MPEFDRFDQRRYPKVGVVEGYRDWTPTYDECVEDAMDLALLDRIESVPWSGVRRVADLGCGTGRTGVWLRSRTGAPIDGVDVTPEMLERARQRGVYEVLLEAELPVTGLAAGGYDLVTCCLVDEHLAELGPLYVEAARLLGEAGRFVLVGYHPSFIMRSGMPTHYEHPERGNVAFETHVHLLGDHAAAARGAGFVGCELHETVVDDEWVRVKPRWGELRDWPVSFAWVWRRWVEVDGERCL